MESNPTISLCMIVKNEEDWIAQCLESVRAIVCEAIVVDTGSTDRTKEIAALHGATVLDLPWQNDFAAARNHSLRHAKGDWILVLDADEVIAPSDLNSLKSLTSDRRICTEFLQRHYSDDQRLSNFTPVRGEFPEYERGQLGYFESNCVRLFPNHEGLEFRGKVHELVEHSIRELNRHHVARTEIRIHHFGHTSKVKAKKNKASIYGPLGEQKTREAPSDWKNFFELGVEYNCNGRYRESMEAFVQSLHLNPNYLDTWVNLGYVFMQLEMYAQAQDALLHALKINSQSSEAYCNLGVVCLRTKKLQRAEQMFRNAIALNPLYLNAYCNLAQSLAHQGRLSESAFYYRRALEIAPQCSSAMTDLAALYAHAGMAAEADEMLERARTSNGDPARIAELAAVLRQIIGRNSESAQILDSIAQPAEETRQSLGK